MLTGLNVRFSNFTPKIDPSLDEGDGAYEVCIANISPKERRKRLNFGILQFFVGFALLAGLFVSGTDKMWRLPLFIVFASGAASAFQSYDKT